MEIYWENGAKELELLQPIPELVERIEGKSLFTQNFLKTFFEENGDDEDLIKRLIAKVIFVTDFFEKWLNSENRFYKGMEHQYTFVEKFPSRTVPRTFKFIETDAQGKKRLWNHWLDNLDPLQQIEMWYIFIYFGTKDFGNDFTNKSIRKILRNMKKEKSNTDEGIWFESDYEILKSITITTTKEFEEGCSLITVDDEVLSDDENSTASSNSYYSSSSENIIIEEVNFEEAQEM